MSKDLEAEDAGPSATESVARIFIQGPIEQVWHELTKTGEPQQAVYGMQLDGPALRPGAPYRARTPDGKHTIVVGEVVGFEPPRLFSHTFRFTHYGDPEVLVTYRLEEVGGGVEVTLTNSRLTPGSKTARDMARGGAFILSNLKSLVEKGRLPFGTRLMYGLMGLLSPLMLKKASRSSNWP